jgi:hypothetical protein
MTRIIYTRIFHSFRPEAILQAAAMGYNPKVTTRL